PPGRTLSWPGARPGRPPTGPPPPARVAPRRGPGLAARPRPRRPAPATRVSSPRSRPTPPRRPRAGARRRRPVVPSGGYRRGRASPVLARPRNAVVHLLVGAAAPGRAASAERLNARPAEALRLVGITFTEETNGPGEGGNAKSQADQTWDSGQCRREDSNL